MSLKLSKNNAPVYDYVSVVGQGPANPATRSVIIDKTGGTKTSSSLTLYLVASQAGNTNIGNYSDITITSQDADANPDGCIWEFSLNGSTWSTSISPDTMNCDVSDAIITIYTRVVVDNSPTTVATTGNFSAVFSIQAIENPKA
jgi:hypothetical protein